MNARVSTKTYTVLGLIFAVFIIGMFALGVYSARNTISETPLQKEISIDVKAMEQKLRSISFLNTVAYFYSNVGEFSEQKMISLFGHDFPLPGGMKSFLISYDGEINMGVDLSKLSLHAEEAQLYIELPDAAISSHVILESTVKLYNEQSGVFNRISVTDYTSFMADQKPKMEEKAIANGYLEQARTGAEEQLQRLIMSLPGFNEEFEIIFVNAAGSSR